MSSSVASHGPLLVLLALLSGCGAQPDPDLGGVQGGGSGGAPASSEGQAALGAEAPARGDAVGTSLGSDGQDSSSHRAGASGGSGVGVTADVSTDSQAPTGAMTAVGRPKPEGRCMAACERHGAPCCFLSGACRQSAGGCAIEILEATVGTLYEYAALEREVAALPQDVMAAFADTDVAWAAADPSPARIALALTSQAAERYPVSPELAWNHPFRLSCNGEVLLLGVTYPAFGAAALKTPVLHAHTHAEGHVVLALGAWQGAWYGAAQGSAELTAELTGRLDRPELREAFCARGVLEELDPAVLWLDL